MNIILESNNRKIDENPSIKIKASSRQSARFNLQITCEIKFPTFLVAVSFLEAKSELLLVTLWLLVF